MVHSSVTSLGPQAVNQVSQFQQITHAEGRTARRQHHDRIDRTYAGPAGRKRGQATLLIMEVDTVLSPVEPVRHQHKLRAVQRMEGMRDPKGLLPTGPIGCI